ncbi:O-antigen ligase family protein [Arthrobacter bambusae]
MFPKLALLGASIALAFLAKSPARLNRWVVWAAAGVLAGFAISAFVTDGLGAGFWGRWPRFEGVPVIVLYLLLLPAGARLLGSGTGSRRRQNWSRMLSWAMALLAVIACMEALGLRPLGESPDFRPGATLGNATDLGIVGLVGCSALLPRSVWKGERSSVVGAACGAIVAIASGSRAVMIVLAVVVLAVFAHRIVIRRNKGTSKRTTHSLAGILSGGLAVLAVFPGVRERIFTTGTVTGRLDLWTATWSLIREHWLWGVGPGHYVDALPAHQTPGFAARVGTDYPADSPHLILLQWWTDGGLLLVAANLALCTAVVWVGIRNIKRATNLDDRLFLIGAMTAVAAFGAVLFTHFPSPGTTTLVGLLAGAVACRQANTSAKKTAPPRDLTRRPLVTAAVVVSVLVLAAAIAASAAEVLLKRATDAVADGKLTDAGKLFDTAQALRPWDKDVALLAGQSFAGRAVAGDPQSGALAAEWSTRALGSNPNSVESLTSLAVGQLATGRVDAAQKTLDTARRLAPVNSQILLQSGIAEYAAGRPKDAISYVEKAASLTPDPEKENAVLAALYEQTGNSQRAQELRAQK